MVLKHYKQTKYLSLNTNDKIDNMKWNIPNYNFSQKAKIALVGVNNATDSNLNFTFCPTIKSGFYSSLNTYPLIYAGIGYNNQNIINGKQYYDVNGAFLNEIELKTYSSAPQRDNSTKYPIIKNETLKLTINNDPNIHTIPNLWCRFETGALTTNSGTDSITLTNGGTTLNAGVSVRGNNCINFNGTSQYLTGNIQGLANNSFSICYWVYPRAFLGDMFDIGTVYTENNNIMTYFSASYGYKYSFSFQTNNTYLVNAYPNDINNWVHLVFIFDLPNRQRYIYRNGVKEDVIHSLPTINPYTGNTSFSIGKWSGAISDFFNGYMDDLRVYTGKVLTPDEITRIYNGTKADYTTQITEPTIGMDLTPNLWLKFDTGALLTNDGTDAITLTNNGAGGGVANAGIAVRGNDSATFNGTNQYLTGTGANLTNNGSFSISMWIYPRTVSAIAYNIISQFYKTGASIWINFSNTYKYEFSGVSLINISTNSTFASDLNTWVNLVVIYDNTTKKVFIYRNGVLLATSANIINTGLFGFENSIFSIGATNTPANFFNGNIDDFRVYTGTILSQAQINEIYAGNTYYNLPTASTKYNTDPTNTQYQFEIVDDEQKIINHY